MKPGHWIDAPNDAIDTAKSLSSLARARALQAPEVTSTRGGELEHLEFWNANDGLIKEAWREWEREMIHRESMDDRLPLLTEEIMMEPTLQESIQHLWNKPSVQAELNLKDKFWNEPIRNVHICKSFLTPQGIRNLRQHLSLMGQCGIPTRRPNGMNRNGFVLDEETEGGVSYETVDHFRSWLVDDYLRPLGRMFFPEYIGSETDDESSYAFTVHYQYKDDSDELSEAKNMTNARKKRDVQLKEHSDASVVTININLNLPEEEDDYDGSQLLFMDDGERHNLEFQPGMAVIHRGLHRHQALPIQKGERHQLIIWLFGTDGYVRVVPYEPNEQMAVTKRWSKPKTQKTVKQQRQGDWDPFEL